MATLALPRLPRLHRTRQAYAFMLRYFTNILSTVISDKRKSSKDIEKVTEKGHIIKKEKNRFMEVRGQERRRDTRALHGCRRAGVSLQEGEMVQGEKRVVPTTSRGLLRGERNDCRSKAGKVGREGGRQPPSWCSPRGGWVWAVRGGCWGPRFSDCCHQC